jgi:hypothetical protein
VTPPTTPQAPASKPAPAGNYAFAGLADFNGDANPDIIARGPGGLLWNYPGSGTRTAQSGRVQIGSGW